MGREINKKPFNFSEAGDIKFGFHKQICFLVLFNLFYTIINQKTVCN